MSLETQRSCCSCGLACLRYAYSLLGGGLRRNAELEEHDVRRLMRKSAWDVYREGASEGDIRRAAQELGLAVRFHRFYRRDPGRVVERLRRLTARNHLCLICVHSDDDPFFHWMCVVGFSGAWALVLDPGTLDQDAYSEKTYWLADASGKAAYAPGLMKVSRLAAWLDPSGLTDEIEERYGGEQHLVLEVFVAQDHRRNFVPGMVDMVLFRRMRHDLDLAARFDQTIDDLRDIFGPPPWIDEPGSVPAHRFIARNRHRIDKLFSAWTLPEYCPTSNVNEEVENLLAVARTYRFTVRPGDEARVWANLSFYLGWFAAECSHRIGKFAG